MTAALPDLPLPPDWHSVTRLGLLQAVGLAHRAAVTLRGWWANSGIARVRLLASNDQLLAEVALLREELRIKDARMTFIAAGKRPHFPPQDRLAILLFRTARGWSVAQTARAMLVSDDTIATWHKRVEDTGPGALVNTSHPVNRYPDELRCLVATLCATLPRFGKQRLADMLARAGLHLAKTTLRRIEVERREPPLAPAPTSAHCPATSTTPATTGRRVTARAPNHTLNVDLTF